GSDYAVASPEIYFAPGETSKTLRMSVFGDLVHEADETFTVNLTSAINGVLGDRQGLGTILDDDPSLPTVAINDVSWTEGNSGTRSPGFPVSLPGASAAPGTVTSAPADGTATSGGDYQAASGKLTIPAGQTTGTITVLVNGDRLPEPNETFFVNLSCPS